MQINFMVSRVKTFVCMELLELMVKPPSLTYYKNYSNSSATEENFKKCSLIGTIGIKDQSTDKYNEIGNTTPSSEFIQAELRRIKEKNIKLATMEVSSHALDQKGVWELTLNTP